MLTKQTFDTCILLFLCWLPTDYSVDKWHNQLHGHLVVDEYIWPGSVYNIFSSYQFPIGLQLEIGRKRKYYNGFILYR